MQRIKRILEEMGATLDDINEITGLISGLPRESQSKAMHALEELCDTLDKNREILTEEEKKQ